MCSLIVRCGSICSLLCALLQNTRLQRLSDGIIGLHSLMIIVWIHNDVSSTASRSRPSANSLHGCHHSDELLYFTKPQLLLVGMREDERHCDVLAYERHGER